LSQRNLKGTNMTDNITIPANAWPFVDAANTDANMTCRQMAILALVDAHPGLSNRPIADALGIQPPVVTRAADRLTELGLLLRMQDDEDRRKVCLTVTAAGQRLLRDMFTL
jgi:DNA-binding MarR family transcriptional regulator